MQTSLSPKSLKLNISTTLLCSRRLLSEINPIFGKAFFGGETSYSRGCIFELAMDQLLMFSQILGFQGHIRFGPLQSQKEQRESKWLILSILKANWDSNLVSNFFCEEDINIIISMPISPCNLSDSWIWYFDKRGNYTVKSGYKLYIHQKCSDVSISDGFWGYNWKSIWDLKVF